MVESRCNQLTTVSPGIGMWTPDVNDRLVHLRTSTFNTCHFLFNSNTLLQVSSTPTLVNTHIFTPYPFVSVDYGNNYWLSKNIDPVNSNLRYWDTGTSESQSLQFRLYFRNLVKTFTVFGLYSFWFHLYLYLEFFLPWSKNSSFLSECKNKCTTVDLRLLWLIQPSY